MSVQLRERRNGYVIYFQLPKPTVPADEGRIKPPGQHFDEHLLKGVVFGLPFGFVVNAIIDRTVLDLNIGVIPRDQVDPLDYPVMFPRSEITYQIYMMAVRLIQDGIIHAQRATFQIQTFLRLIEQIERCVGLPL
jgi:hypothetical protein